MEEVEGIPVDLQVPVDKNIHFIKARGHGDHKDHRDRQEVHRDHRDQGDHRVHKYSKEKCGKGDPLHNSRDNHSNQGLNLPANQQLLLILELKAVLH